ncbi:RNI-like protein [Linnemannia elongata AG-77]|uniref:RNI-like protein n=1 Tax=Linnemannia elongata AG-77 TaxID=1314771 RepID=A0A197JKG8_9FUNG|nr:RNI-like protein [Linnemannia elongata AG-77]
MGDTQSFRLIESTDTVEITLHHGDGQNIIYWEDIERVFLGVKRVCNGSSVITFLRVSDQQCINSCSRSVLDVVLSTSVQPVLTNPAKFDSVGGQANAPVGSSVNSRVTVTFGASRPIPETPVSDIGHLDTPSSPSSATSAAPKAALFQQIVTRASGKARESEVEQRFISLLAPEVQKTVRASSDIYQAFAKAIKGGDGELSEAELKQDRRFQKLEAMVGKNIELQEALYAKQEEARQLQEEARQLQEAMCVKQEEAKQLQEQVLNNQEEMKQLQLRALDQLAVLQSRVQAVLTQTYELHEYPIPRLFVVLPQDSSGWDAVNPFSNKFRLYFLCECGEHTKSTSSKAEISHDIHFAKHEGYEIVRPSEFFQQYGPYVLTILKMLKFGISVAGVVVPAVSHLVRSDAVDQATASLQQLKDNIEPGMDHVIGWMDGVSVNEGEAVDEFSKQMEKKEALEGADLRKLDTFLMDKDGNKVLGNLYRTVTDEGHVKWFCLDHYRANYQENSAMEFQRVLDSVGGSFSESLGRVEVRLRSRVLAEQFYSVLGKTRSVYELDIGLDWACTTSDLEALEKALRISRVSILRLDLRQFHTGVASKLLSTSAQYDIIFHIRDLPSMKLLHILLPKEFVKFIGLSLNNSSPVCNMSCELTRGRFGGKEFGMLVEAIKANSTLTTLDLGDNSVGDNGAQALSEALKTNSTLTTLNLLYNSIGSNGAVALSKALKTNSTLTTLNLGGYLIGDNGAQALSEALKTNSTLTTLNLLYNSIGDNGARALSEAFKTNSTLTTLNLQCNSIGDNGAQALSEALKTNSTLTTLNLLYNSIGDNGARALSEAFKTNSTLTTLNLQCNSIGDNGAQALSEALKTNSTLTSLDLGGNSIGGNGAQALSEARKTNSTVTTTGVVFK